MLASPIVKNKEPAATTTTTKGIMLSPNGENETLLRSATEGLTIIEPSTTSAASKPLLQPPTRTNTKTKGDGGQQSPCDIKTLEAPITDLDRSASAPVSTKSSTTAVGGESPSAPITINQKLFRSSEVASNIISSRDIGGGGGRKAAAATPTSALSGARASSRTTKCVQFAPKTRSKLVPHFDDYSKLQKRQIWYTNEEINYMRDNAWQKAEERASFYKQLQRDHQKYGGGGVAAPHRNGSGGGNGGKTQSPKKVKSGGFGSGTFNLKKTLINMTGGPIVSELTSDAYMKQQLQQRGANGRHVRERRGDGGGRVGRRDQQQRRHQSNMAPASAATTASTTDSSSTAVPTSSSSGKKTTTVRGARGNGQKTQRRKFFSM